MQVTLSLVTLDISVPDAEAGQAKGNAQLVTRDLAEMRLVKRVPANPEAYWVLTPDGNQAAKHIQQTQGRAFPEMRACNICDEQWEDSGDDDCPHCGCNGTEIMSKE
ncbi:MAG: hypothetical protein H8E35_01130 [Ardenticatenia bacterium]|nr:hypothetical protein [Ardenticatenia bacterium]